MFENWIPRLVPQDPSPVWDRVQTPQMLLGFCYRSLKLRARGAVEFARQHLLFFAECYVSLAVKRYLNKAFSG